MVSKVLSITEEVYFLLKSIQLPQESFGDTIKRLCSQYTAKSLYDWCISNPIEELDDSSIWEEFERDIIAIRKRSLGSSEIEEI